MSLSIRSIETFLFRAEVSEVVKTSFGSIPRRSVLLIRIEDQDGVHGWGEVWCNFPAYSADNKVNLFDTIIAPAVFSSEFDNPSHAWHVLTEKTRRWRIQSGEHGPISACLAGVDLALWDLSARREGKSLSKLLGTSPDVTHVNAYASGLNPDSAIKTIERARKSGFDAFKVKVAFGFEQDIEVLREIFAQLQPNERLMVDANQGWSIEQARRAIAGFSEFKLGWIE